MNKPVFTENPDAETLLRIEDDVIRVEFVYIGEGICGDYNPEDPDDVQLLRFDVSIRDNGEPDNEWVEVDDASYCTTIKKDTPMDVLKQKIKIIFNEYRNVADHILQGGSVKKLGETLSLI